MTPGKNLGINTELTPWMFKYKSLGWSYKPTNPEQWQFLEDNKHAYLDSEMLTWIYATLEFKNNKKYAISLRDRLIEANNLYRQGAPDTGIEDSDYDRLLRELEVLTEKFPEIDTPDSPANRIGAKPNPDRLSKPEAHPRT